MSKVADRNQRQLLELLKIPGNEICADCRAKNPRWASADRGVFICMTCAGVHRSLGTHISKVRSLTLDTWTKEQVEHMRSRGNLLSNLELNPSDTNQLPPSSADEGDRKSQLEKFIRDKYEYRAFAGAAPRRPAPAANSPSSAPLLVKPPLQSSRRSPSPAPLAPPLPARPATTPTSRPEPLLAEASVPQNPPRPFAAPVQSSTPSPESKKSVRFRAASVPILDDDLPLRVPSRAGETRPPAKGILRPRSATTVATEGGSLSHGGDWAHWASNGLMSNGPASSLGLGLPNGGGGGEQGRTTSGMSTASFASMMSQGSASSKGPSQPGPAPFGAGDSSPFDMPRATYGQAMRVFSSSPTTMQLSAPAPVPPPPQAQRLNSSIWDDLDALGTVGVQGPQQQAQAPFTPGSAYPSSTSSFATSSSPFDTRTTSPFGEASPNGYAAPAPLRPQLTGFVPSSQFGQQLASEIPPTSRSDSAPFLRPQQTGYYPSTSFAAQQTQPQTQPQQNASSFYSPSPSTGWHRPRPAVSTNPFQSSMLSPSPMDMSSLGQSLPQVQTPMRTGGGTNPFFSGYQPQQQQQQLAPMQPHVTGMPMQNYNGQGFGGQGLAPMYGGAMYAPSPIAAQATGQQFARTNPFFGLHQQQQQQQYGQAWGA